MDIYSPSAINDHFEQHPYATHFTVNPSEGIYCHGYRDEAWESDDIEIVEALVDASALIETCSSPVIRQFLGVLGLHAAYNSSSGDIMAFYPNTEKLSDNIDSLQQIVPLYSPPRFRVFDGKTYTAQQFLETLTDGAVLISRSLQLEHDMVQHAAGWLAMPPHIFTAMQRRAEAVLCDTTEVHTDLYNTKNQFMNGVDLVIGNSPIIGKLMVNPDKLPLKGSTQEIFMDSVVGRGLGSAALVEMGAYAHHIGSELMQQ